MSSQKPRLAAAKSLPNLKVVNMSTASQVKLKPEKNCKFRKLPYEEERYQNRGVLVGSWQEHRITDLLPKLPFQDAYMDLQPVGKSPDRKSKISSIYKDTYLKDGVHTAAKDLYECRREERVKNSIFAAAEAPDNVFHPARNTSQHDQGAAWHSLYHQSYSIRNPKTSASKIELAVRGAPEMRYGLWDRKLAKWAKQEADSNTLWTSTYQMVYPVKNDATPADVPRRFIPSLWRRQEGNIVIGNPRAHSNSSPRSES